MATNSKWKPRGLRVAEFLERPYTGPWDEMDKLLTALDPAPTKRETVHDRLDNPLAKHDCAKLGCNKSEPIATAVNEFGDQEWTEPTLRDTGFDDPPTLR